MKLSSLPKSDCFEELVREHQAGLRAYIRALGAQDAWVDDIAQEAFLLAYRRLDRFQEGADFGRWLRGIARNLVLNDLRKNSRRSRLLHDSIAGELANVEEPEPFGDAPVAGLLQAMADCVARLPARSRELLQRRYSESADASTLAQAFQLSAAAVRQTLVRTRAAVRRCMQGKFGEAAP